MVQGEAEHDLQNPVEHGIDIVLMMTKKREKRIIMANVFLAGIQMTDFHSNSSFEGHPQ